MTHIKVSDVQDAYSQQIAYYDHKSMFFQQLRKNQKHSFIRKPNCKKNNKDEFHYPKKPKDVLSSQILYFNNKNLKQESKIYFEIRKDGANYPYPFKEGIQKQSQNKNQSYYRMTQQTKKEKLCLKKVRKNEQNVLNLKSQMQTSTSNELQGLQEKVDAAALIKGYKSEQQFLDESYSYISYSDNEDQQDQKKLQTLSAQVKKQFSYSKADGFDKMRLQAQQIMERNVQQAKNYLPLISNYEQVINTVTKGKQDLNFPSTFKYEDGVGTCQKIVYFFLTRYGIGKKTNNALFCFSAILRDSIIKIMGHEHWKFKQPSCLPPRANQLIKMSYNTKHIDLLGKNIFKKLFYIFFLWLYDKNFTNQLVLVNSKNNSQIFKQDEKIKLKYSSSIKKQIQNLKNDVVKIENLESGKNQPNKKAPKRQRKKQGTSRNKQKNVNSSKNASQKQEGSKKKKSQASESKMSDNKTQQKRELIKKQEVVNSQETKQIPQMKKNSKKSDDKKHKISQQQQSKLQKQQKSTIVNQLLEKAKNHAKNKQLQAVKREAAE